MRYRILTDEDVRDLVQPGRVVAAMRQAFEEDAAGTLEAPPRWSIEANEGSLVFTVGAAIGPTNAIGFRVYETYPESGTDHEQLVAVFDATTGALGGLFVGHAVGRWRTGGIGGVAVDALAREDVRTLGLLGAGSQAETQLAAAAAVRDFDEVNVYSPTRESRESFAREMDGRIDPSVDAVDATELAVRGADVLICVTTSTEPVFDADWLEPGVHVTSVGPKFEENHELPLEVIDRADVIATDSLAQVDSYKTPFVVSGANRERMVGLTEVLAGERPADDDPTLFCSVGLAGTEVVLGKELLDVVESV